MGVSVGIVNLILNVFVIGGSYLCVQCLSYIQEKFILRSLKKHRKAPAVYEPDSRIWSVHINLRLLIRSGSIVYIVIKVLAICTGVCAIIAQFGVEVSERCRSKLVAADGICAHKSTQASASKEVASALFVAVAPWRDADLDRYTIWSGFRKRFDGTEDLRASHIHRVRANASECVKGSCVVVAKCQTTNVTVMDARSVRLSLRADVSWGVAFDAVVTRSAATVRGRGAILRNKDYYSATMVAANSRTAGTKPELRREVELYEYAHTEHLSSEYQALVQRKGGPAQVLVSAQAPLVRYAVTCSACSLEHKSFQRALMVFRATQLSSFVAVHPREKVVIRNVSHSFPAIITPAQVKRAVISYLIADRATCPGHTYVYTRCGYYEAKYAVPFVALLAVVLICSLFANLLQCKKAYADVSIPSSAYEWDAYLAGLGRPNDSGEDIDGSTKYRCVCNRQVVRDYVRDGDVVRVETTPSRTKENNAVPRLDGSREKRE